MSCEVYANGNEIACKGGGGKVIAAFPDVCLTPPPPPAGPIPVPYPNTSFSKDMKDGSKKVKIKGKEVMLKDKSHYKSSPLGDEAATNGQGAGVVSHSITGKTHFMMWSMDVKVEGANADRHTDITTSNHQSPMPGNEAVPMLNAGMMAVAAPEDEEPKCECCGKEPHSESQKKGESMSEEDFYTPVMGVSKKGKVMRPGFAEKADKLLTEIRAGDCKDLLPPSPPGDDPCAKYYKNTAKENKRARYEFEDWKSENKEALDGNPIAHKVALAGGGCPTGSGNHSPVKPECEQYEADLAKAQHKASEYHRKR